eukprot:4999060-Amphidinium_carterae.1
MDPAGTPATWASVSELLAWAGVLGTAEDENSDMSSALALLGAEPTAHWRPLGYFTEDQLR